MGAYVYPALYALFVWWFSTGLIILLDNLPQRTFRWSLIGGTAVFLAAMQQLAASSADNTASGVYAAFTCAVLAWGWQEMTFFMGALTGPRKTSAPAGATAWQRFGCGVAACLWHELAIIVTALVIAAATWNQPNHVGLWTFIVLWVMRQSAKLNFFLGVRNTGEQFIPSHLGYMRSFIAKRRMNLLMPASILGGTIMTVVFALRAAEAGPVRATGMTFLATMLGLAVIEHCFLVLPAPFEWLWSWVLRWRRPGSLMGRRARRGAKQRETSHELRILLP